MPKRKTIEEIEEIDTPTEAHEAVIDDETGLPWDTAEDVSLPEDTKPVQLSPYEGCVIWGSWRGSAEGWWEVTDGKLVRVPDAHQLHPWKRRLDHLPGNIVPSEMELA